MFADIKSQTDAAGHSPFTKRQPYQPSSSSSAASSMMDAFLQEKTPTPSTSSSQPTPSPSLAQTVSAPKPSGPAVSQQQIPAGPTEPQASSPLPLQQHKLKHQKKRTSITTKVGVSHDTNPDNPATGVSGVNWLRLMEFNPVCKFHASPAHVCGIFFSLVNRFLL